MYITQLKVSNFTTFEENIFIFGAGINVFIGENGSGKTHILKLLYSACQSANPKVSFSDKLVRTMLPDDYKISRLITRKPGNHIASVKVIAKEEKSKQEKTLSLIFNNKTKKSNGEVHGDENWEKLFKGVSSIFIPAKEILSNSYNLAAAVDKVM